MNGNTLPKRKFNIRTVNNRVVLEFKDIEGRIEHTEILPPSAGTALVSEVVKALNDIFKLDGRGDGKLTVSFSK